jgi:hypothetical protein
VAVRLDGAAAIARGADSNHSQCRNLGGRGATTEPRTRRRMTRVRSGGRTGGVGGAEGALATRSVTPTTPMIVASRSRRERVLVAIVSGLLSAMGSSQRPEVERRDGIGWGHPGKE